MTYILHVVSSVDPALGGVAESIRARGVKLLEMGHQVEVASMDAPGSPAIAGYPLPLHTLGPGLTPWCYSPKLLPWLRANCKRFDAVVVDGIWQYHGTAVRRALKGSGVPYFVFPHGMLDPWFKRAYPLKHLKKWLFWPWAEYRVLGGATAVLFTCEEERRAARESFWLYRASERVVTFGTEAAPSNHVELRNQFFLKYPDLAGKKIILFLGRIHPKKGCDLLIEAFARIKSKPSNLDLVMVGPCEEGLLNELKTQAKTLGITSKVHWLGLLKGADKWGAMFASDAFILPSHQENFGIAVAEALSCGLPVLISNKVNIWNEILSGQCGFVGNDTADGTKDILRAWLETDQEHLRLMSRAAIATFQEKFTIEAMANGLLSAVKSD